MLGAMTWAAVGHAAGPVLIAIGKISALYEDFATQTAGPLESGFLVIASADRVGPRLLGGDYFLALPTADRTRDYNDCDISAAGRRQHAVVHQPLSYRSHEPGAERSGSALPFTLTPMVVGTTLLSSRSPLVYGPGCGPSGAAAGAQRDRSHVLFHRPLGQLRSDQESRLNPTTAVSTRKASACRTIGDASTFRRVRSVRVRVRSPRPASGPGLLAARHVRDHRAEHERTATTKFHPRTAPAADKCRGR